MKHVATPTKQAHPGTIRQGDTIKIETVACAFYYECVPLFPPHFFTRVSFKDIRNKTLSFKEPNEHRTDTVRGQPKSLSSTEAAWIGSRDT